MQQKLSEMVEIPIYARCPVCGNNDVAVYTEVDKNRFMNNKVNGNKFMTMTQICDRCCERGWRHSIDGDVVRLRFIYDSKKPWIVKDYVIIDRL